MKKFLPVLVLTGLFAVATISVAHAEEKKVVGPITKIQLGVPTAESATVTVKDKKTAVEAKIIVRDEATLDKLKSKKMSDGDEVRAKFDTDSGEAKSLKRTAGCD